MRKRTSNPGSINVNVNVNITVGSDKTAAKSAPWCKWLVLVLKVVAPVAVALVLLLTVPNVDPAQCAKLVRTFISTLVVG